MLNADAANIHIEREATRLQTVEPSLNRRHAVQIARLDAGVLPPDLSRVVGSMVAQVQVNQPEERETEEAWFRTQRKVGSLVRVAQSLRSALVEGFSLETFDVEYPDLTEAHWNQIAFCLEQSEVALMYAAAVLDTGAA